MQADVTIVIVPRERFSYSKESLESIYEHTEIPFELVYIDGRSPDSVYKHLKSQAEEKGFKLIRKNRYLSPNEARNIGIQAVDTKYLVFVDNDVVVSSGWLKALVNCAESNQSAVVGPLQCEGLPLHQTVHCAGGEAHVVVDVKGRQLMREKMYFHRQPLEKVRHRLTQRETELIEFHCMLVRRDIFEQVGLLDESMLNIKEHVDFCMQVAKLDGKVYFEPDCVVTYVYAPPIERTDLAYYMLRWGDDWTVKTLEHFREKWNLLENQYFKKEYKKMAWRRHKTILKPFSNYFGENKIMRKLLYKLLIEVDKKLNPYLSNSYLKSKENS